VDIGIILSVLESGNSVELQATGYSMFPTFRPGYRIVVRPLTRGEVPEPGCVVVYNDNGVLVLHRLIEVIDDGSGNTMFIARGDSLNVADKPFSREQLVGVAVSYKTGKKETSVRNYIPGQWRYRLNSRMLWLYIKIFE